MAIVIVNIHRWHSKPENTDCSDIWFNNPNLDSFESVREINYNYALAYDALPFIPNMQFSIMKSGSFIPPHTDISNKVATLMIYLPSSSQINTSLGTTFWLQKSSGQFSQHESSFLKDSNLSIFKERYYPIRTPFQGENAILFYRSDSSWHSFEYESTINDEPP